MGMGVGGGGAAMEEAGECVYGGEGEGGGGH